MTLFPSISFILVIFMNYLHFLNILFIIISKLSKKEGKTQSMSVFVSCSPVKSQVKDEEKQLITQLIFLGVTILTILII